MCSVRPEFPLDIMTDVNRVYREIKECRYGSDLPEKLCVEHDSVKALASVLEDKLTEIWAAIDGLAVAIKHVEDRHG